MSYNETSSYWRYQLRVKICCPSVENVTFSLLTWCNIFHFKEDHFSRLTSELVTVGKNGTF